ncbi:MAG: acyl-[ACP]--phospholipid O-acyltransferase [Fibrobacteria bacterium]|nr:acyl-[ACP]--phospholipid O-acyltransferase [Fibrobacteria bacterium]
MQDSKSIWNYKGTIPYLLVVFLNAFTDLGHKIVIQNAIFKYYDGPTQMALTAIVNGLILLPFIMTFTPAGFLSDKFAKNRIIRIFAFASIPITILITVCYLNGAFWPAFGLTFLLALQSAFYAPAKYGYIKELFGKEKLATGNGAVQAVTIFAILSGIFLYSILFEYFLPANYTGLEGILSAIYPIGYFLIFGAVLETILSFFLPKKQETDKTLTFSTKQYLQGKYLSANLKSIWGNQTIRLSIIGLGIFWAVNQVILVCFPVFLKEVTLETNTVVAQGIMAMAGVGVILGSIFAARVSKNYIETGIIPLGAIGMSGSLFLLPYFESRTVLGALCFTYGFFGGMFIVPLNALIQFHAGKKNLGKILAGTNFIEKLFILGFLVCALGLSLLQISPQKIFLMLFIVTLLGTLYTVYQIPQSLIRYMVRAVLSQRYHLQVQSLNNIPSNKGTLLLGNHISFLDWAVLQMACPRSIRFVMHRSYYEKWYIKWILDIFKVIPIASGASKKALDQIHQALKNNQVVAIFPEGHISHTGHLSTFRNGFERAAKETGAIIVPFYIKGLWGSKLSRASEKMQEITKLAGQRTITVTFGRNLDDKTNAAEAKQAVLETSIHAWKDYAESLAPLPISWLRTAKKLGKQIALHDASGVSFTQSKLLTAVLSFSGKLKTDLVNQQNIGILLPPSAGGVIANMSVLLQGKTVVNLNYTTEPTILNKCAEKADIKTILASKLFIKKLTDRGIDLTPLIAGRKVIYLEEVKKSISKKAMILMFAQVKILPAFLLEALYAGSMKMNDTAAILFSSGSEGDPKGVQLSHTNIMGNLKQTASVINPTKDDVMLCSLPLFHAFGLTITTFLPLVESIPVVCQPDPTDARTIGKLVAQHKVSILCATSTFLRIYTRHPKIQPLMFQSLRLIVAGAERLREDVRKGFKEKFGKDVIEGYGTTETTPVAGVNIPDILLSPAGNLQIGNKTGTVGMPLPGSTFKIVDPETLLPLPIGEAGLILIGGTQIMLGYLNDPDKTNDVIVEKDGIRWYKSGDRGKIDEDGFLTILDRYSRFAKIGGEMISLSAVETKVTEAVKDNPAEVMAVNLPDSVKGEVIVLLYEGEQETDSVKTAINSAGIPPLMKPKEIIKVDTIPKLGTGKSDFAKGKILATELTGR